MSISQTFLSLFGYKTSGEFHQFIRTETAKGNFDAKNENLGIRFSTKYSTDNPATIQKTNDFVQNVWVKFEGWSVCEGGHYNHAGLDRNPFKTPPLGFTKIEVEFSSYVSGRDFLEVNYIFPNGRKFEAYSNL